MYLMFLPRLLSIPLLSGLVNRANSLASCYVIISVLLLYCNCISLFRKKKCFNEIKTSYCIFYTAKLKTILKFLKIFNVNTLSIF